MESNEFESLEKSIHHVQKEMDKFDLNPDVPTTYLLGPTGSGKSTLANCLLGASLNPQQAEFG